MAVPCVAAVVGQVIGIVEHPVRQPIAAHLLPDILLRVQLGALGWQRNDGDVIRHVELLRQMPAGLVEQQHRVTTGRDIG